MNKFMQALDNSTRTSNGMLAWKSTLNPFVDLFGSIGSARGTDQTQKFAQLYAVDKLLALRLALWTRDVRGGAGERQIFRDILKWLGKNDPSLFSDATGEAFLMKVIEVGRCDDLISGEFEDNRQAYYVFLRELVKGNKLAAKWAPRKGPKAQQLRKILSLSPKAYRQLLVQNTQVVETLMCSKAWSEINFSHVPSQAMIRYRKAFGRNDQERFGKYLEDLKAGTPGVKVNATTSYPYQIVKMYGRIADLSHYNRINYEYNALAESMWDALPDYMNGANVLSMVDNSGSMEQQVGGASGITALEVAASLGLYTATKTKGAFKDTIVSFSSDAKLVSLGEGSLHDKLTKVLSNTWGGSTNLMAAFDSILHFAIEHRVPQEDMPTTLVIFSDMQFDSATEGTAFSNIGHKYSEAGYIMPKVIFWNLCGHTTNHPVLAHESGAALVSGFSPALMKAVLEADTQSFTPENIMLKTLMSDRYAV